MDGSYTELTVYFAIGHDPRSQQVSHAHKHRRHDTQVYLCHTVGDVS